MVRYGYGVHWGCRKRALSVATIGTVARKAVAILGMALRTISNFLERLAPGGLSQN